MILTKFIIFVLVPCCLSKTVEITFKDVTFRGYSVFTEKFKKTIPSGNRLKDFLPHSVFDAIKFSNQNIPILYKDSLSDLDNLDEISIENCEVEEIRPGAISNAPLLRIISLKGNKLKSIDFGVFNNLQISVLDLSMNQITYINSKAFDNMPDILNIKLSDNQISVWNPDWFKNTPLLTRISMQNNSLETLPANAFKNLKGEKKYGSVDLTLNLIFSHNKLESIHPKAFADLKKINNLWLDNNLLKEFNEDLLDGVEVDDLRLNKNQIKCFEGELDRVLKANTNHIDSNPFDCECLEKVKSWSQKKKNVEFTFSEMECITQRVRVKMDALEKRLKELKEERFKEAETGKEVEEVEIFTPKRNSIK